MLPIFSRARILNVGSEPLGGPAFGAAARGDLALGRPDLDLEVGEPAFDEPALAEPALGEPALDEPALGEPALSEPTPVVPLVDGRALGPGLLAPFDVPFATPMLLGTLWPLAFTFAGGPLAPRSCGVPRRPPPRDSPLEVREAPAPFRGTSSSKRPAASARLPCPTRVAKACSGDFTTCSLLPPKLVAGTSNLMRIPRAREATVESTTPASKRASGIWETYRLR